MKKQQPTAISNNSLRKDNQRQLKELIDSYFLQIGTDMENSCDMLFSKNQQAQEGVDLNISKKKKRIQIGRIILISTIAVLLCTMIGIFQYEAVLMFGLVWGLVFTRYEVNKNNDLTEMLVYWMIFSLLISLQNILKLSLFFMPFYHSVKLFFLISLLYPSINLKNKIYREYFSPRITLLSQNLFSQK